MKIDHVNPTPTAKDKAAAIKPAQAPFVRSPYNYDMNQVSDETGLECRDQSLTQQQFAEESDINYIADRYGLTGEIPQVLDLPGYGNFEGVFDFQTAQQAVIDARNAFMTLPAKLRTRFDNDPQKLIEFMDKAKMDVDTAKEAEFLGLLKQMPLDQPQSPQGNAADTSKGGTLPPDATPAAAPDTKPAKKAKDT